MQSDGHLDLEGQRVLVNLADTEISYIIYIYIYTYIYEIMRDFFRNADHNGCTPFGEVGANRMTMTSVFYIAVLVHTLKWQLLIVMPPGAIN